MDGPIILCFMVLDPFLKFIFRDFFFFNSGLINERMASAKSKSRYFIFQAFAYHAAFILTQVVT